jgi:hypothetical protein
MKTVTVIKDAYIDNSVRVNYFDKNATRKEKKIKNLTTFVPTVSGEEYPDLNDILEEVEVTYDKLLFCVRLKWTNEESELDEQIEAKKLELEANI